MAATLPCRAVLAVACGPMGTSGACRSGSGDWAAKPAPWSTKVGAPDSGGPRRPSRRASLRRLRVEASADPTPQDRSGREAKFERVARGGGGVTVIPSTCALAIARAGKFAQVSPCLPARTVGSLSGQPMQGPVANGLLRTLSVPRLVTRWGNTNNDSSCVESQGRHGLRESAARRVGCAQASIGSGRVATARSGAGRSGRRLIGTCS